MARALPGFPGVTVDLGMGAAKIIVTGGSPQQVAVTKPFPTTLGVRVLDSNNVPMTGVYVTFSAPASGPSAVLTPPLYALPGIVASGTIVATDISGQAFVTAVANKIANLPMANYQAMALLTGVTPAIFTLTNLPGPATAIVAKSGGGQSQTVGLTFAQLLVAAVVDAYGNVTPDAVRFNSPSAPGATFSKNKVDALGFTSTQPTADTVAGAYNVDAMSGVLPAAKFALTNKPGPAVSITASGGTPQSVASGTNFPQPLQAAVKDQYGNGISGAAVTFNPVGAGIFQGTAIVTTGPNGVATSPILKAVSTPGNFKATATATGVSGSAVFNLSVDGATTTVLSATPGGTATFGQQVIFTAAVAPGASVGSVDFYDVSTTVSGTWIGVAPILNGVATFKTNLLDLGAHQFRAVLPSAGLYLGSTSNTVFLTVNAVPGASFLPSKTFGTLKASRLISADLNSDGKADLVALSTNFDTVAVLLGDGSGGFTQGWSLNLAGFGPTYDVVVTDVNRDGILDIVISHEFPGGLDVLLGNGDGTFQKEKFTAGAVHALAAGDFNNDSKPHVVATNTNTNDVTLWTWLGNGKFQSGTPMPTGAGPFEVIAGDFNADGNLDIATANYDGQNVTVLLGNGNGTFETHVEYPVGSAPVALITGKFHGAQAPLDLVVVAATGTRTIRLLTGNGNGTFGPAITLASGLTAGFQGLAAGDFNGDGNLDLAVSDSDSSTIQILLGNGDGTFQPPLAYMAGSWSEKVVVADFNGDGRTDIAVAGQGAGVIAKVLLSAVPANVAATGTPQSKAVTTSFSQLGAAVTDANGIALANVPVTWQSPVSGASAVLAPVTLRTGNGLGGTTLGAAYSGATANKVAGSYAVSAAVAGIPSGLFSLKNLPGPPASITATAGSPQSQTINLPFAAALKATVLDAYNNPVPATAVTFAAPATGASAALTAPLVTDGLGTASVTATANAIAGNYLVTAATAGVSTPALFNLTNLMSLSFVSVPPGLGFSINNINYVSSSGPLSFEAGKSVPVNVPNQVQTIIGQNNTKYRFYGWSAPLNLGPASQSLLVPSTPTGNVVANFLPQYQLTLVGTATTSVVSNPSTVPPDANGYYTVSFGGVAAVVAVTGSCIAGSTPTGLKVQVTGSGGFTNIANGGNVAMDAPKTVTVLCPPPPASISVVSGTPQSAVIGAQFAQPLQVVVRDANNNPMQGVTVSFAAPSSGASAVLTAPLPTDSSGSTSVTATANSTSGTYTVNVTVAGVTTPAVFNLTNLVNLTFVSVPANLGFRVNGVDYVSSSGSLSFAAGQSVPVDVPNQVQTIIGQNNTKYRFYGWSAPLNLGPASQSLLVPSTPTGNVVANFLPQYQLTLVGTATTSVVSNPSTVPPDANGYYTVSFGGIAAVVSVTGSCIAGATPTGLSVSGSTSNIANGGNVAMDAPRTVTVLCPPPPASISVMSGTPQSTVIGTPFSQQLKVAVRDAGNNPVQGVTVSFSAPSSGASAVLTAPSTTDTSGSTSVTATANSTTGIYAVNVTVAGVTTPAVFNLTNLPSTATISYAANYADAKFSISVNSTKTDYTGNSGLLTVGTNDTVVISLPSNPQSPAAGIRYNIYGWNTSDPVTLSKPIGSGAYGLFFLASYKLTFNGTATAGPSSTDGFYMQTPSVFIPVTVTGSCPGGATPTGLQIDTPAYYLVNGPLTTPTTQTVANGSTITMDGPHTVTVKCPALPTISVTVGSPQSTATGKPFAQVLQVLVRDGNNNPVQGATVSFTAPLTGASAVLTAPLPTDSSGLTSVTATANSIAGSYTVSASTAGASSPALFLLSNTTILSRTGTCTPLPIIVYINPTGSGSEDITCSGPTGLPAGSYLTGVSFIGYADSFWDFKSFSGGSVVTAIKATGPSGVTWSPPVVSTLTLDSLPSSGEQHVIGGLSLANFLGGFAINVSGTGGPASLGGISGNVNLTYSYTIASSGHSIAHPVTTARYGQATAVLPSGKVLVAGGYSPPGTRPLDAQIYDPANAAWAATAPLPAGHALNAIRLSTGEILVVGDEADINEPAHLYDEATATWSATGVPNVRRFSPATSLLPSGEVLMAGGYIGDCCYGGTGNYETAETYNRVSNTWTSTGSMAAKRAAFTATVLPNGKVLAAGGAYWDTQIVWNSAELYDPDLKTWSPAASMNSQHSSHTATLLPSGKVLVVGGWQTSFSNFSPTVEMYDPAANSWSLTGSLASARAAHTATLLPSGKILVAGGYNDSGVLTSSEIYDPVTGLWTSGPDLETGRSRFTSTLLSNGTVLSVGGYNPSTGLPTASAEVYH